MQMKQKQNQSYKELCAPFLNKLRYGYRELENLDEYVPFRLTSVSFHSRFLLYEVRPATSHEVNAIERLQLLYTETRFKKMVKRVMADLKRRQCKLKEETSSLLSVSRLH